MRFPALVRGIWPDDLSQDDSELSKAQLALQSERFGEAERLARGASELRCLVKALLGQGRRTEALAAASEAKAKAKGHGLARAKALLSEAELVESSQEAELRVAEAMKVFQGKSKRMEVLALLELSRRSFEDGEDLAQLELGLQRGKEAKAMARELNDRRLEAMCVCTMIDGEGLLTSAEDAILLAEEALDLCLNVQDRAMEALVLCRSAAWHAELQDFSRGISDASEALEIYRSLGSPQELLAVKQLLQMFLHLAELREARQLVQEALKRHQEKDASVELLQMLAEVHLRAGDLSEASSVSGQCIQLCKELGRPTVQAAVMLRMSQGRLDAGDFQKAMQVAEDVFKLLQDSSAAEKVRAMELLCQGSAEAYGTEDALGRVEEFLEHFEQRGEALGAAKAAKLCCGLQLKLGRLDMAQEHGQRAYEAFRKARRRLDEAESLKLLCQVLWKRGEHKAALRQAEVARQLFRDLEKPLEEVSCLYIQAENAVRHAVQEGLEINKINKELPPREARQALEKALRAAEAGLKLLRRSQPSLHAELLCAKAQALTFHGRFETALECLDEAVLRFRELDDYQLEANALMLAADNLEFLKRNDEALEALEESLALCQHCGDAEGEGRAETMLRRLRAPRVAAVPPPVSGPTDVTPVWMQGQEAEVQKAPEAKAAKDIQTSQLNVSAVTPEMVMAKVKEVALALTQADDMELELPLMEAGMTSASAVQMQQLLVQALPGVSLPVTLVFDYPSIMDMSDFIAESVGVQAIAN